MLRRPVLHGLLAALIGLIPLSCSSQPPVAPDRGAASRPPNVILVLADDLGTEGLGCYGGTSYSTPHLDRLADQGLRFTHAYSQPLCTNTRIQLMTGLYNDRNWLAFGLLAPDAKTIGHHFSERGYRSLIAGKWQLQSYDPPDYPGAQLRRGKGMHPADAGFDEYSLYHSLHTEDKGSRYADPTYLEDGKLVREVQGKYGPDLWVDRIDSFIEKNRDHPFFVYYPMALPHWPVVPTPRSETWADPRKRLVEDPKYFKDMVEYMDHLVGRITEKVDSLGLSENTLIVFFSDNGTHLDVVSQTRDGPVAGGKGLPTDAGTRVPLIARWPGNIRPGTCDDLVDSTDFLPTLLEATGKPLPVNHGLDGVSFYPRLLGQAGQPRQWVYCFYDPRPGWDKDQFTRHVWARDRRWKLYEDGRLFDIEDDVLEERPILEEVDRPETSEARRRLREVLVRNARIAAEKKKKKKGSAP